MKPTHALLGLLFFVPFLVPACSGGSPGTTSDTDAGTETETEGETTGSETTDNSTSSPSSTTASDTTEGPQTTETTTADPTTSTTEDETTSSTGTGVEDDTIYDIQEGVISEGSDVDVQGVYVTAIANAGFYIQEPEGGQYSGVWVYAGDMNPALETLTIGDEVDVMGTTAEFEGLTEIDIMAGTVTPTGNTGSTDPELVAMTELVENATAEPWEGVLIRIEGMNLDVVDEPGFNEFDVSDGESTLRVDEQMFNLYDPDWADDFPNFNTGAAFTAIQGPLNYTFEFYKIAPRDENDVEGYVPGPEPALGVNEMVAGDLIVTEVMYDAGGCGDADCEWIEIYNNTGEEIDLKGLIIRDQEDDPMKEGSLQVKTIIPADGYAWLGRGSSDTWGYENPPDNFYGSDPGWNNATQGDLVILRNDNEIIDQTGKWMGMGNADDGMAWQLSNGTLDADANDDPGNWCLATVEFDMNGDMGSPGVANPEVCP